MHIKETVMAQENVPADYTIKKWMVQEKIMKKKIICLLLSFAMIFSTLTPVSLVKALSMPGAPENLRWTDSGAAWDAPATGDPADSYVLSLYKQLSEAAELIVRAYGITETAVDLTAAIETGGSGTYFYTVYGVNEGGEGPAAISGYAGFEVFTEETTTAEESTSEETTPAEETTPEETTAVEELTAAEETTAAEEITEEATEEAVTIEESTPAEETTAPEESTEEAVTTEETTSAEETTAVEETTAAEETSEDATAIAETDPSEETASAEETTAPEEITEEAVTTVETDPVETTPVETTPAETLPAETDPAEETSIAIEETDSAEDPTDPAEEPTDPAETEPEGPRMSEEEQTWSAELEEGTITVWAEAGAFPENATLSAATVPLVEQYKVETAVDEVREEGRNVAVSYTFDIKILDGEGNELQPAEGKSVKVSFEMSHVASSNLTPQVYHTDSEYNTTELSVETEGETATVETGGFSFFTVEFTYGDLQYVMEGQSVVKLQEILDYLEIGGRVKGVSVSAPELFNVIMGHEDSVRYMYVYEPNGAPTILENEEDTGKVPAPYIAINDPSGSVRWIASYKPFASEEWMDVLMEDGSSYHIIVTDAIMGDGTDVNIPGLYQGENLTNFAPLIPVADIWIDASQFYTPSNESKVNGDWDVFIPGELMDPTSSKYNAAFKEDYPTNEGTSKGSNKAGRHFVYYDSTMTGYALDGYTSTTRTSDGATVYQSYNYFEGTLCTYKWEDAAVRMKEDGTEEKLDVYIEYSNPMITIQPLLDNKMNNVSQGQTNAANVTDPSQLISLNNYYVGLVGGNVVATGAKTPSGAGLVQRYGLQIDVKPYIKDKSGNLIDVKMYFPMTDLDVTRSTNGKFAGFYLGNALLDNYDPTSDNYSEGVRVKDGLVINSSGDRIYIPGSEGSYASTVMSDDGGYIVKSVSGQSNDGSTFNSGFLALVQNGQFNLRVRSSAGNGTGSLFTVVMSGGDYNYRLRHSTETLKPGGGSETDGTKGGTIRTTREGNHNGELNDGEIINPSMIATAVGQTIVYTFTPQPGYALKDVYIWNDPDKTDTTDFPSIADMDDTSKPGLTKIKEGDGTNNTYESFDDDGDGVIDRYTYSFTGIHSDNAIHVVWVQTALDIRKSVTGSGSTDDTFTFTIKAWGDSDSDGTDEFVDFSDTATMGSLASRFHSLGNGLYQFTLDSYETISIPPGVIPFDFEYEVEEVEVGGKYGTLDGWTAVGSTVKSGKLTTDNPFGKANFVNTRSKEGNLIIRKVWENDDKSIRPSNITVYISNTNDSTKVYHTRQYDVDTNGDWVFKFSVPDDGTTWNIWEVLPDGYAPYYTLSSAEYYSPGSYSPGSTGTPLAPGTGTMDNPVTGAEADSVTVLTNTRNTHKLTIRKTSDPATNESFTFTLKLWSISENNLYDLPGDHPKLLDHSIARLGPGTYGFTLIPPGEVELELPAGIRYRVEETPVSGWSLISELNTVGLLNSNRVASFTNVKDTALKVVKTWENDSYNNVVMGVRPTLTETGKVVITVKAEDRASRWKVTGSGILTDIVGTEPQQDAYFVIKDLYDGSQRIPEVKASDGTTVFPTHAPKLVEVNSPVGVIQYAGTYVVDTVAGNTGQFTVYPAENVPFERIYTVPSSLKTGVKPNEWLYEFDIPAGHEVLSVEETTIPAHYQKLEYATNEQGEIVYHVVNSLDVRDLEIYKETVEGVQGSFEFTVEFYIETTSTSAPTPYILRSALETRTVNGLTFTDPKQLPEGATDEGNGVYRFTLSNGEKITFSALPLGVSYEIKETVPAGWEQVSKVNEKGSMSSGVTETWIYKGEHSTRAAAEAAAIAAVTLDSGSPDVYINNAVYTDKDAAIAAAISVNADNTWKYDGTNYPTYNAAFEAAVNAANAGNNQDNTYTYNSTTYYTKEAVAREEITEVVGSAIKYSYNGTEYDKYGDAKAAALTDIDLVFGEDGNYATLVYTCNGHSYPASDAAEYVAKADIQDNFDGTYTYGETTYNSLPDAESAAMAAIIDNRDNTYTYGGIRYATAQAAQAEAIKAIAANNDYKYTFNNQTYTSYDEAKQAADALWNSADGTLKAKYGSIYAAQKAAKAAITKKPAPPLEAKFTNKRKNGTIKVEKQTVGNEAGLFTFRIMTGRVVQPENVKDRNGSVLTITRVYPDGQASSSAAVTKYESHDTYTEYTVRNVNTNVDDVYKLTNEMISGQVVRKVYKNDVEISTFGIVYPQEFTDTSGMNYKFVSTTAMPGGPQTWELQVETTTFEFKLKNGEHATIEKIPYGSRYRISEVTDATGWELIAVNGEKTTVKVDGTKYKGVDAIIQTDETVTYTFLNDRIKTPLTVTKVVEGNQGSRDKYFKFKIEIENAGARTLHLDMSNATTLSTTSTDQKPNSATQYTWGVILNGHGTDGGNTRNDAPDLTYGTATDAQKKACEWTWTNDNGTPDPADDTNYRSQWSAENGWVTYAGGSQLSNGQEPVAGAIRTCAHQHIETGNNGKATIYVYLQHDQSVTILDLPFGAKYIVTEVNEDYRSSTAIDGDDKTGEARNPATGGIDVSQQNPIGLGKGKNSVTDSFLQTATEITFTNTKDGVVPTEIRTRPLLAGLILMAIALPVLFGARGRRMKEALEEVPRETRYGRSRKRRR